MLATESSMRSTVVDVGAAEEACATHSKEESATEVPAADSRMEIKVSLTLTITLT